MQWKFLLIKTTVHSRDFDYTFPGNFFAALITKITFLSIKTIASHTHVIQYHTSGYESYVTFINIKNMDMHIDISVQFYEVTCQIRPIHTIPHTSELL